MKTKPMRLLSAVVVSGALLSVGCGAEEAAGPLPVAAGHDQSDPDAPLQMAVPGTILYEDQSVAAGETLTLPFDTPVAIRVRPDVRPPGAEYDYPAQEIYVLELRTPAGETISTLSFTGSDRYARDAAKLYDTRSGKPVPRGKYVFVGKTIHPRSPEAEFNVVVK